MNETAKNVLLDSRRSAQSAVENAEFILRRAQRSVAFAEEGLDSQRAHLADLNAALTEAGVDLAAEDLRTGRGEGFGASSATLARASEEARL